MEIIKAFLEKIKKDKPALVIFALSVAVILLAFSGGSGKKPETNQLSPVNIKKLQLKLLNVTPQNGRRESVDKAETLMFTFSQPIRPDTIKVTVNPSIRLKILIPSDNLETILITPDNTIWQPQTTYSINISQALTSESGDTLDKSVDYTYYNNPPKNIEVGD